MKNSFTANLKIGLGISLCLLYLTNFFFYRVLNQMVESAKMVNHTNIVIEQLEIVISKLKDAQTGSRGYVITGEISFLEHYNHAFTGVNDVYTNLLQLTSDNPVQQENLRLLNVFLAAEKRIIQGVVHKKTTGKPVGAEIFFNDKKHMDRIRLLIKKMQGHEGELLKKRSERLNKLVAYIPLMVILISLLTTILTLYFYKKLRDDYNERVRLQKELLEKEEGILTRINIIQNVADKISEGNYSIRIKKEEKDILGNLANSLNQMAASLEYSFNAIRELMQKKDEFIGVASHELKTPLTSIKATLQFVSRIHFTEEESRKVYPFLVRANNQVNRLTDIVRDLLDVTNINLDNLELRKSCFSIRDAIIDSTYEIFMNTKTHELVLDGDADLKVDADRYRVDQVLINLVSNALKYSPEADKVIIRVTKDSGFIKVSITDFGIGIPAEKIPYIFNRYYRVQESSQNFAGLGLGLYISNGIIERHGGKMGVESDIGKGSTFWFTLPAAA